MRVILNNGDIRHWSDNLDWGISEEGHLDVYADSDIIATYPVGAWLGVEEPEPKQKLETYSFAVYEQNYRESKEVFHYIDHSIGTQEMVTSEKMDDLVFLGEGGQEIRRFTDWSIVFRRLESGYMVYQVNPHAHQQVVKRGCVFAGEMMYAWVAENWRVK